MAWIFLTLGFGLGVCATAITVCVASDLEGEAVKERDIKHENGRYWVGDVRDSYTVYKAMPCHYSVPDSSYEHSDDGLSIAIARCNYLAERPCRM